MNGYPNHGVYSTPSPGSKPGLISTATPHMSSRSASSLPLIAMGGFGAVWTWVVNSHGTSKGSVACFNACRASARSTVTGRWNALPLAENNSSMCWYISIAVPDNAVAEVCAAHGGAGISIAPTRNPSALAVAGAGWTPLLVTGGGCSCAWYRRPNAAGADEAIARAQRKYEKMHWSSTKIARALASMRPKPRPDDGLHPVIIDMLTALLSRHGTVRVWVHDFSGGIETETYQIASRAMWPDSQLASRAATLEPDVLSEFIASRTN